MYLATEGSGFQELTYFGEGTTGNWFVKRDRSREKNASWDMRSR